ncbi:MAG: hypothetical protein E7052_07405 [Lentisphaerae bacterium]|nr:hypothetical protein [Lentisphaerota bacterium]
MARRNDESSPVSLFSFQDIITSITGIMFLVVLLLVVMMLNKHIAQLSEKPPEIQQLQDELSQMKKQLQELQTLHGNLDSELNELQKLSPEALERKLTEERRKIHELRTVWHNKQQMLARLQYQYQEMQDSLRKLKQQQLAEQTRSGQLQNQITETQQQIKIKELEIKQKERLLKYTIANHGSKQPLLIELNRDGVQIFDIAQQKRYDLRSSGDAASSIERLPALLGAYSSSQYYFSAAIAPNGFAHAEKLLTLLKHHNFERGFEILPDNKTSIFEESEQ